jgi:hypothetical protein
MERLLSCLLFAGITVGASLAAIDSTRFVVAEINAATAARCATYNSVLPGACRLP